jgi:hypothetical protein
MATFISLHIKSDNRAHVAKLIQELSDVNHMTYGSYPTELDENILLDENANPNFIAIGDVENGWISVQLNSFKKLHDWTQKISKELNTSVVQVIGQTASDAYYFLMYDKGTLRREIEIYYGELDNIIDKGEKFAFEKSSLVPLNDDDYENLFNRDTLEQYCKELGFDLFNDVQPEFYYILKNKKLHKTLSEILASKKKPWWKFW